MLASSSMHTTQNIRVDDLINGITLYEPELLRTDPIEINDIPEKEVISAAAKTAKDILKRAGLPDVKITEDDVSAAEHLFMDTVSNTPITMPEKPEIIVHLEAIVALYDHRVIQHADQIRYLVTNKLLELSDHKDPRVQLKAVELMGKIADVGMFVEKQEITFKQQSSEDLQQQLRKKLGLLIEGDVIGTKLASPAEVLELNRDPSVQPLVETPKIDKHVLATLMNS
jgi:hypothetical protein